LSFSKFEETEDTHMWERNDGTGESNILQNEFTAYLGTAIRRRKVRYLRSKMKLQHYELSLDIQDYFKDFLTEPDMILSLPVIEQLESIRLQQALKQTKSRDLYIFLAKALEGRSNMEIAHELGIGHNAVTVAYHRMIQRLKKVLGGEDE